jgi:hypothetical protein
MNSSIKWGLIAGAAVAVVAAVRARQTYRQASVEDAHQEDRLNEALEDSFPASDPPAHTPTMASAVGV